MYTLSPSSQEKKLKIVHKEKKAQNVHKTVARGCKVWMWLSHKLFITLFHIFETFYLSRFFMKYFFKNIRFQLWKNVTWSDEITHPWLGINELFCVYGDLSFFIAYFERVPGREHLKKAVSTELLDNFYFWGITLKTQFCDSISPNSNLVEIISNENVLELLEFYSPSCF